MIKKGIVVLFVLLGYTNVLLAQSSNVNYGNGLPATDALGRQLPLDEEVGGPKDDKYIGVFCWTWHLSIFRKDKLVDYYKKQLEKLEPDFGFDIEVDKNLK